MNSAGTTAVVKSVSWAGFVMCSGTSESESDLAESSDEESSDEAKRPDTGAEDKEPETAGFGLKAVGLGAGSADQPAR